MEADTTRANPLLSSLIRFNELFTIKKGLHSIGNAIYLMFGAIEQHDLIVYISNSMSVQAIRLLFLDSME